MASRSILLFSLIIMSAVLAVSCSSPSNRQDPVTTGLAGDSHVSGQSSHFLWGYYLAFVDPSEGIIEMVPARDITGHWNILKFLEQGPCTNCVKILSFTPSGYGTRLVNLSIQHPFSGPTFTGFDVRGIAMFNGSREYPVTGLKTSDRTSGEGELVNADGFTSLYNSTTAGSGFGGFGGYLKGKFATATPPDSTLNGYRRHITDVPSNTRNALYAGDAVIVTYDIDMPDTSFVFGYAIDASWATPDVIPPVDVMDDFPPDANCPEAYNVAVEEYVGLLTDIGGSLELHVRISDHQGPDTVKNVHVECPELFFGALVATKVTSPSDTYWSAAIQNDKDAPEGTYKLLVSVEDVENTGSEPWMDLTAYQIHEINVGHEGGWVDTWGGPYAEHAYSTACDSLGNIYVCGDFSGTVDFDPGAGQKMQVSVDETPDAFLCKFDSLGNLVWVKTWGGTGTDSATDCAILSTGNTMVITGYFEDVVDFDPGAGTQEKTSNGGYDVFSLILNVDGIFSKVITFGGTDDDHGYGVASGSTGSDYVLCGTFQGTIHFPNNTGIATEISSGGNDAFLWGYLGDTKKFMGAWGGTGEDYALEASGDSAGYYYATGSYFGTVDFDPLLASEDNRTSNGLSDIFLVKYRNNPSDFYEWVSSWGGPGTDSGNAVAAIKDGSGAYVTGSFALTADFNPAGAVDNRIASGAADAFISRFGSSGDYQYAVTWGGADATMWDSGHDILTGYSNDVYVCGYYAGTCDFNPGSGQDTHTADGLADAFVSRFSTSLSYDWSVVYGGNGADIAHGAAVSTLNSVYVTGGFLESVGFDPDGSGGNKISNGDVDAYLLKLLPGGVW